MSASQRTGPQTNWDPGGQRDPIAQIRAKVADKEITALVDTGSSVNLLSYQFLMKLSTDYRTHYVPGSPLSHAIKLLAFDGRTRVVPEGHIVLPVTIGKSRSMDILFYVTETASHPILLGTPSIKDSMLVVDLAQAWVLVKATNEIVHLLQETSQSSSCNLIPLLATEGFTIPAWSEWCRLKHPLRPGSRAWLKWMSRFRSTMTS